MIKRWISNIGTKKEEKTKQSPNNRKKRLRVWLLVAASVLAILAVFWGVIGMPIYDFGLGNAEMKGISYSDGINIYSPMNESYGFEPNIFINDKREFFRLTRGSDGVYRAEIVAKLRTRIILTPLNFDTLLRDDFWCAQLTSGETVDAKYIRDHYTAAWVDTPDDNPYNQFYMFILMDDGNVLVASGALRRVMNGKMFPPSISKISSVVPYGDSQDFYDHFEEMNKQ